jgi:hypothetical protein
MDEGLTRLACGDPRSTLEDLATLGWETAARILWIRDNACRSSLTISNALHFKFRRDAIKCGNCVSSASLIRLSHNCQSCRSPVSATTDLAFHGPAPLSGTADRLVQLGTIECGRCGGKPFYSINIFYCSSCSCSINSNHTARITPNKEMVDEMFGGEIKDHELTMTVA